MHFFYGALTLLVATVVVVDSQTIAGEMFSGSGGGDLDTTTDSVDVTTVTTVWDFSGDTTTPDEDLTTAETTTYETTSLIETTTGAQADNTTESVTETTTEAETDTTTESVTETTTEAETDTTTESVTETTTEAETDTTTESDITVDVTTVTTVWDFSGDTTTPDEDLTTAETTTYETTILIETTTGAQADNTTESVTETTTEAETDTTTESVTETTTEAETDTTTESVTETTTEAETDTTTESDITGCPVCVHPNSNCSVPNKGCVCDFGFVGVNGGIEPPCREPFCNETCIGAGQICNGTNDCVCDTDENYEEGDGVCTKVCPSECGENSKCQSADVGCICNLGFSTVENETACADINECDGVLAEICPGNEDSVECFNTEGSYICECKENYYYDTETKSCEQSTCDAEAISNCLENSFCKDGPPVECICNVGYEKTDDGKCQDIDECVLKIECFGEEESCANTEGSFTCGCIDGYYRDNENNECVEVTCSETTVSCMNLPGLCSSVGNTVTFPETLAGYTAITNDSCAEGTSSAGFPLGTRPCSLDGQWGTPTWLSSCDTSLQDIADEEVTDENIDEVSNNLEVLTSKPESLDSDDIDSTTAAITEVTKAENISDSVATSVVTTISNLMESPSIEDASDSGELVTQLNDVARKVEMPSTFKRAASAPTFTTTSGDIAIVVQEGTTGFGVAVLRRPENTGGFRSDQIEIIEGPISSGAIRDTGDRVQASIYVPAEATKKGTRSWVIVYGSNVLFQRNVSKEAADQRDDLLSSEAVIADEMVLSAVVMDKNITGLKEGISYSLPVSYGFGEEPVCAFWVDTATEWATGGCDVNVSTTNGSLVCDCDHLTSFAALTRDVPGEIITDIYALDIITIVGCSISSIALLAVIFILSFCSRMSWRGRRYHASFILVSLSVVLLGLNITLLVSKVPAFSDPAQAEVFDSASCIVIAIFLHFFVLSSCAWMNCEAVVFGIAVIKPLYTRNNLENKQVLLWSILWAILMPLLFVIIIAAVDIDKYVYSDLGDSYVTCWLRPPDDIIYFAVIPTSVMIVFNLAVYIVLSYYLCRTRKSDLGKYWKSTRSSQKRRLATNFTIVTTLGLILVFGFFMSAATYETPTVLFAYIFTISTSLQGLFILLVTVLRNAEMRRSISKKLGSVSSVFGQTSPARHEYTNTIRSASNSWHSQYSNTSFSNPGNPYTVETEETHPKTISQKAATYSRPPTNGETYSGNLVIENWRTRRHSH